MPDKVTIHLAGDWARQRAVQTVNTAPSGYYVTISEPTRTLEQNRLLWPLIKDVREQVLGMADYTADETKLRFLNALAKEAKFLPELEGNGMFPVGQRSSTLTKSDFSMLIELMFAFGAKHGVTWSARSEQTRKEAA